MRTLVLKYTHNTLNNSKINNNVIDNFINIKLRLLIPPFLILFAVVLMLYYMNALNVDGYINVQKELFFYLNSKLSELPNLQINLTQLGDVMIVFSLITIFIIYAPKLWEAMLTSSIISLIVSYMLKKIFAIPRPAHVFDNESFIIIGKTACGFKSLPSGHSITTFIVISILLYAFMPKKYTHKVLWSGFIISLGLIIVFSRVGVGAHYPIDVVIGSVIGYIIAIIGIKISNKVNFLTWNKDRKPHPILMLVLTIWAFFILKKIIGTNLLIFYISLLSLAITLYLMASSYVKK